jgi:hypothetical protein
VCTCNSKNQSLAHAIVLYVSYPQKTLCASYHKGSQQFYILIQQIVTAGDKGKLNIILASSIMALRGRQGHRQLKKVLGLGAVVD